MPHNPVRFKELDVRRAVRAAAKEGLNISGFAVLPDGTIRIHTTDDTTTVDQTNPWDEVLGDAAHQERAS